METIIQQFRDTSLEEHLAVLLGLVYVFLAIRGSKWCWPPGILSSAIFVFLFWKGQLFAEAGLYVFYVFMGFYGWLTWEKKKSGTTNPLNSQKGIAGIEAWTLNRHALLIGIGIVGVFLLREILLEFFPAEAKPWLDSITTVFALIATYLTAKKELYNWIYWIAVDVLSVYLYFDRGWQMASLQMVIFTILAAVGYLKWKKSYES